MGEIISLVLVATGSTGLWFATIASRYGEDALSNFEIPGGTLISLAEVVIGVILAFSLGFLTGVVIIGVANLISMALTVVLGWHVQLLWIASQAFLLIWTATVITNLL